MSKITKARLRVPTVMAVGGTAIAAATFVSNGWRVALGLEVLAILATIGYFVLGGRDSDIGALFGSRADERQVSINRRAAALSGNAVTLVGLGAFMIETARGNFLWPFGLVFGVGSLTYVVGLLIYRHG